MEAANGFTRRTPALRAATLAAAAACLVALTPLGAAGQAGQVWASQDGKSTLEIRAFYKTLGTGVCFQSSLVNGLDALDGLIDAAHAVDPAVPPPEGTRLPSCGASSANTVRGWGRFLFRNRVEFSAGWQADAIAASDRAMFAGAGLGGTVPVTSSSRVSPRRLVDVNQLLVDRDHFRLQHNLDLAAVKFILPKGEIVAGRQVLSWGTGRFWNPTDLLSPFAPTDVDREVRHGVDAVRFSMPLSTTSLLDVLYLPQRAGWAQGGVVRAQANFRGYDVSLSAAKYRSDYVVGADTAGDVGPVGVHAEAAYTFGQSSLDPLKKGQPNERFLRAVAGVEWKPSGKLIVGSEYYFNGFGATEAAGYAAKLASDRVARGEISGVGRHYLGASAVWQVTELLSLQTLLISNLADPSAVLIPVVEHWTEQRIIVRAGGYIPLGASPDATTFTSLTVNDVIARSAAFLGAASSLGLRSEYGISARGVFAQVGVYF